jgi:hypothetical protein
LRGAEAPVNIQRQRGFHGLARAADIRQHEFAVRLALRAGQFDGEGERFAAGLFWRQMQARHG